MPTHSKQSSNNRFSFLAMTALSMALFAPGAALARDDKAKVDAPEDKELALAQGLSSAFQRVAKNVTPAIVHITAVKGPEPRAGRGQPNMEDPDDFFRRFFGPGFGPGQPMQQQPATSFGSGIVVTEDGYVLTNNHVIDGARKITVALGDNRSYEGKLIGRDPETDVAVIKIDGSGLTFAPLGDSDKVAVGEWALAIGNPFGLNQTVTAGIISAKGRTLPNSPGERNRNRYEDFIQTDAAINPGNSGGALVNLKGQVIGMNTAIFSRSGGYMGIGFAIPSNMAKGVMDSLIATGSVQRGWLGVGIQPLDENTAKSLGYEGREGVVVNQVFPGGPAEKAGLQSEDIITAIDGRATGTDNQLRNVVATLAPGKSVKLDVFRAGKKITIDATIAKRDEQAQLAAAGILTSDNKLGLGVANMTQEVAQKLGLRRPVGVVVTEIKDDAVAAGFVQPEDVVLKIDGRDINTIEDFKAAAEAANIKRGVRIIVFSNGIQRLLTLRDGR